MPTFVLVHGAFLGAWVWEPVIGLLERDGAVVRAPDLPGSGSDRTPPGEVTLASCVERVAREIDRFGDPAVLAGQGLGGIVITQVAAQMPEAIARLVYISGLLPREGESALDLTRLPEAADEELESNMTIEGPVGTLAPKAIARAFFNTATARQADAAIDLVRPQPLAPFGEPVALERNAPTPEQRVYVHCLRDHAIPFALQRRMVQVSPCATVHEIDSDHCPSISHSHKLARLLASAAPQRD